MKFSAFLKDKWVFLLSQTAIILFLALLLNVMDINNAANALVCICLLLITIGALVLEFVQKNSFYKQLYQNLDAMEKKHYISSVIEEAGFTEGVLLIDVLKQTTKSMNDAIAAYRRMNTEYQDYIETWIHEIKIPISCIDLICENNKGEIASGVKEELSRIDGYVEQALYYARSTNLEKDYMIREIRLDELIKGILKKHSKQLISAKATPHFDNLSQTVYGDPKWLEFILGQLIANSIKYKKETLTLTFSACEEQNNVLLYISDDGIGIPESELPRIFEKGFTGTNGRSYAKSTGIGLYLCRQLCNKMRLSISAYSASGQGTTMQITFPKDSRLLLE
ncbi:MAG: HAMP domain-containing histidine kinase [Dorea sp.]|nr:HAMP domain-containing histidine kinase [Dorea sp.]